MSYLNNISSIFSSLVILVALTMTSCGYQEESSSLESLDSFEIALNSQTNFENQHESTHTPHRDTYEDLAYQINMGAKRHHELTKPPTPIDIDFSQRGMVSLSTDRGLSVSTRGVEIASTARERERERERSTPKWLIPTIVVASVGLVALQLGQPSCKEKKEHKQQTPFISLGVDGSKQEYVYEAGEALPLNSTATEYSITISEVTTRTITDAHGKNINEPVFHITNPPNNNTLDAGQLTSQKPLNRLYANRDQTIIKQGKLDHKVYYKKDSNDNKKYFRSKDEVNTLKKDDIIYYQIRQFNIIPVMRTVCR